MSKNKCVDAWLFGRTSAKRERATKIKAPSWGGCCFGCRLRRDWLVAVNLGLRGGAAVRALQNSGCLQERHKCTAAARLVVHYPAKAQHLAQRALILDVEVRQDLLPSLPCLLKALLGVRFSELDRCCGAGEIGKIKWACAASTSFRENVAAV